MKYYSETLKKLYDTEKDLVQAEGEAKKAELEKLRKEREAKEARATRAKEVEEAIKAADAARVKANQLLSDFSSCRQGSPSSDRSDCRRLQEHRLANPD